MTNSGQTGSHQSADELWDKSEAVRSNWSPDALRLWLRDRCRCTYCDTDLIFNRGICYCFFSVDHLLPKSEYLELEMDFENRVLSCRHCNLIKRDWDPNRDGSPVYFKGEKAKLSHEQAAELKARARRYVTDKRKPLEDCFEDAKRIIVAALGSGM